MSSARGRSVLSSLTKSSKRFAGGYWAWWADRLLLEGQVHALMAAVLLRAAWFDALNVDAEAEPPDGELGEIEQGVWASEGYSVVGSYCLGKAPLAERRILNSQFSSRSRGV